MLLVKAQVKPSDIAGLGLFADEPVSKGTTVAIFTHGLQLIHEDEYNERSLAGDPVVVKTACRFIDHLYLCRESGKIEDEDYVNHSFTPNLLYHCGICIAMRDLAPGEEMTVNYQFLLSADEPGFHDKESGKYVTGLPAKVTLYQSAKQLALLMRSCLDQPGEKVIRHPAAMANEGDRVSGVSGA